MASTTYYNDIQKLYVAYFNRPADVPGLQYWESVVEAAKGSTAAVSAAFARSTEYKAVYGNLDYFHVVGAVYQNLFGHQADVPGLNFWAKGLQDGAFTVDSVVTQIAAGAQGTDLAAYKNKVLAAGAFTSSLTTTDQILAYSGDAANAGAKAFITAITTDASYAAAVVPLSLAASVAGVCSLGTPAQSVTNFTLTTGTDNVVANVINADLSPFSFNGKGPTLNVFDAISGVAAATNNTLNIFDQYGQGNDVIPAGVKISNVQTINLNTQGSAGGAAGSGTGAGDGNIAGVFNVAGITGLKNVNVNSAGGRDDRVQADQTTSVNVSHSNIAGGDVIVVGGLNDTVTTSAGSVTIGSTGATPLSNQVAAGAVTVNQNGTGSGNIKVFGGTDVTINVVQSSHSGAIEIGNTSRSVAAANNGANPTGTVTVNVAGKDSTTVFGGTNVVINNTATEGSGAITVGDMNAGAKNLPSGTVTITEGSATAIYNGNGAPGADINVYGGTDVAVTTHSGSAVNIGLDGMGVTPTGAISVLSTGYVVPNIDNGSVYIAGGTTVNVTAANSDVVIGQNSFKDGSAADNPTGNVTVTETAAGAFRTGSSIVVDGGAAVKVTALGQYIEIGVSGSPTGDVTVSQKDVLTGSTGFGSTGNNAGGLTVVQAGKAVTVTTTGGSVLVGSTEYNTKAPTGAINIVDTFSGTKGSNAEFIEVNGGTTVNVKVGATDNAIVVGNSNIELNADGVTLKNTQQYAKGDITIVNDVVNNGVITYGAAYTSVSSNGAAKVSITGGSVDNVTDVQTTATQSGATAGAAVGTSTLATVIIDGNQSMDAVTVIKSDALTNLTVTNDTTTDGNYVVTNGKAAALNLTVGGNKALMIQDNTATALVVTDNGVAGTGKQSLLSTSATAATFANSAAQSFSLVGDAKLASITATSTGNLALGDVTSLTKLSNIDVSKTTGSVSVSLDATVTSFNGVGSTGNDTVTIKGNTTLQAGGGYSNIIAGSGSNTLVANYVATTADAALGSNSHIKGFTTLTAGTAARSATTHAAYQPNVVSHVQVDTVTVSSAIASHAYAVTVNGTTYTYTTAASGDTVNTIAAALAGKVLGGAGLAITYTPGTAAFTITGAAAGTAFTDVGGGVGVTSVAGNTAIAGDAAFDASGFTALRIGATAGDVTFSNVGAGTTLTVTASQGGSNVTNYLLQKATGSNDALALSIGNSLAAATTTVGTTGIENLSIASTGFAANTVTIGDSAAKAVTITGTKGVTVTLKTDALGLLTQEASLVTTIDASGSTGSVNVMDVALKNAAAHTITGGAGVLTAQGGMNAVDVDTITTGAGGGSITVGKGGSWVVDDRDGYAAGSESIVLSASAATSDTLIANDGAVATFNGTAGGVTGFVTGVANSDKLSYTGMTNGNTQFGVAGSVKIVLANVTAATIVAAVDFASASAGTIDTTGALFTKLAYLTYTASNGVITFSAVGGHQLADFTSGELVSAAEIILNAAGTNANGVPGTVAAFSTGGSSYVVASDAYRTLAGSGWYSGWNSGNNDDSVINLRGVASVSGFGITGATGTVVANVTLVDSTATNTSTVTTAQVFDNTGFAQQTITLAASTSYALNNLAASAVLNLGNGDYASTNVSTTQLAPAGGNSLTVNGGNVKCLTVAGDAAVTLNNSVLASLVDSTNTLKTLTLGNSAYLGSITSTSLTTIDATAASGVVSLGFNPEVGAASPLTQSGLTIKLSAVNTSYVEASGSGLTITQATGTGDVTIGQKNATNGTADVITLSNGNNFVSTYGAGDKITVGSGSNHIFALGSNDIVTITGSSSSNGNATVTVGSNATVNITSTGVHHDTIVVGTAVTNAASAGAYACTKVAGFTTSDTISFAGGVYSDLLGGSVANSQVNVSTATTLAQALDLAANVTLLTGNKIGANAGVIDWFQFQGNTYIVEAQNTGSSAAKHTALGTHDVVVQLVGLVDITHVFYEND